MKQSLNLIKKIFIAIIGIAVFVVGIALIPLPGPGLVVCFLGLLILSVEFEWARKHRDNAKARLDQVVKKSKDRNKR